jgi:hypothetical protein
MIRENLAHLFSKEQTIKNEGTLPPTPMDADILRQRRNRFAKLSREKKTFS